jgi:hypothetical protein
MLMNKLIAKARGTPRKRQAKQFGCGYAAMLIRGIRGQKKQPRILRK